MLAALLLCFVPLHTHAGRYAVARVATPVLNSPALAELFGARDGRTLKSDRCGQVQLIPRSLCAGCQHTALAWKVSGGRGRILSHTTVHRAPTPAFRGDLPYVIALVDMDEGFRLMVNVQGGAEPALAIGQPVRIGFVEVEGMPLPIAQRLTEVSA